MKMKVNQIKEKVAAKVAKGKAKVAKKCGKAKVTTAAILLSCACCFLGCQSPAQRAQTADVTQEFYLYEGATASFTFGSEFVSLAQSNETGGNDAGQVATQTTETKPEVAVGVGGSSAGVGGASGAAKQGVGAAIGSAMDAIAGAFPSASGGESGASASQPSQTSQPAQASQPCADGSCADCEGGACAQSAQ